MENDKFPMTDEDYVIYEHQKSRSIGKYSDLALPVTSFDQKYIRHSESQHKAPSEITTQSAADYISKSESLASTNRHIIVMWCL